MVVVNPLLGHELARDHRLSVEVACIAAEDQTDRAAVDRTLTRRHVTQRPRVETERSN